MKLFSSKKESKPEEKKSVSLTDIRHSKNRIAARFDAAQTTRDNERHWSMADACSADAEAQRGVRETLRKRSRYEVLNNSYAKGLVMMLANDTIGTGPRLQYVSENDELNDRIESAFSRWATEINLAQKLRLMRMARCQDGESFAVIGYNPKMKNIVKIKLDIIEADRIKGDSFTGEFGENEVDGIKFDSYGNPVSYRMMKYHPGDIAARTFNQFITINAESMIHTFVKYRPGLHRGVPELTSALPLFAQLRRYNLASLAAAEAAADFSAVLYTDSPADGESEDVEPLDSIPLERNMMVTMPAGWKLGQLEAKHPTSNHSEFVKCILSEIARCVCSTYGTVAGNFSGFNYASGRLDNQVYQKSIIVDRSLWECEVLNPIFDAFAREWSLATGTMLPEDGVCEWFWDGFIHADPTKEANAQSIRLNSLTTTLADEYAKEGKDYMKKLRQIARERKLARELGIVESQPKQANEEPEEE